MSRRCLAPHPDNASSDDLDAAIRAAVSDRSRCRLRAIKALLLGVDRDTVAKLFSVDARTLRRWIVAYNRQGIDGLIERRHPGRPRVIKEEQALFYAALIEQPALAGVTHWTARKFHGYLCQKLGADFSYAAVVRFLHRIDFVLRRPQPYPDRAKPEQRAAFVAALLALIEDPDVDLWFCDEMGVEGDPKPRRRWAKKGSKPRVVHNGDHLRMNVCGMVAPRTGEAFFLEFSHVDREVFQVFLDHANATLQAGPDTRARQIVICDNARWHKGSALRWGRFEPMFLPIYSPDLNPIERLWQVIKAEWFADFAASTEEQLVARLDAALCWATDRLDGNRATCAIRTEI